jgi:adenosylcobinamide-GDP ribazoletransferase
MPPVSPDPVPCVLPLWRVWPRQLLAALLFYTQVPFPAPATLTFDRIACWAPVVGLGLGIVLAWVNGILEGVGDGLRSGLVVCLGLWITGGLHLDGAMDTADGLSVPPERRLAVMADSRSGAMAVMVAVAVLLLKTLAVASLQRSAGLALVLAASWGRWGQQVAIAAYPYLKPTGKGAIHQRALGATWELLPGLLLLLGVCCWPLRRGISALPITALALSGGAIALGVAHWFGHRLGGHTGDSYGAVVEWTETLTLVTLAIAWGTAGG